MYNEIKNKNVDLEIQELNEDSIKKYGKIVSGFNFTDLVTKSKELYNIPENGTAYVASSKILESEDIHEEISKELYGGSDVQIGWCIGHNQKLNAFEYHKGCELIVAVTDIILILADLRDVNNNEYLTEKAEIIYVKKGEAVELYSTTMHFAPISVNKDGFAALIILPRGTNEPLECSPNIRKCDENELLWMKNKWMICHPESPQAQKGAFVGLLGKNIEIKI